MHEAAMTTPRAFISYAWSDASHAEWVREFAAQLVRDGVDVQLDQWGLRPGQDTLLFMEEMVGPNITKVILLVDGEYAQRADSRTGGVGVESQIISKEVYSRLDQTKYIPIVLSNDEHGSAVLPVFLRSRYYLDFSSPELRLRNYRLLLDAIFDRYVAKPPLGTAPQFLNETTSERTTHNNGEDTDSSSHQQMSGNGSVLIPEPRSPYRSLEAFQERHAESFFGRTRDLDEPLRRFQQDGLLAVVGPSGCGKSSFVQAGLVPAIRQLPSSALGEVLWDVVVLRPGKDPLGALASALLSRFQPTPTVSEVHALRDEMFKDGRALGTYLDLLYSRNPGGRLLLVIDQFEEALSDRDNDQLSKFVEALLATFSVPRGNAAAILTLRADLFGRCWVSATLIELLERIMWLLPPLTDVGLQEAIELPAAASQRVVEPQLTRRLVELVRGEPGHLPLLQHVLHLLWSRKDEQGRFMTLAAFEALGGLERALADQVEATIRGQDLVARRIFERLVSPGSGTPDTRAQASYDELCAVAPEASKLVDKLVDSRLLTIDLGPERLPMVQVAHEALIRYWDRLQQWLRESREAMRLLYELRKDVAMWAKAGRSSDELWRGNRLALVLDLRSQLTLTDAEQDFLDSSVAAQGHVRTRQILKWIVIAGIAVAGVTAVGLFFATLGWHSAHQNATLILLLMVSIQNLYATIVGPHDVHRLVDAGAKLSDTDTILVGAVNIAVVLARFVAPYTILESGNYSKAYAIIAIAEVVVAAGVPFARRLTVPQGYMDPASVPARALMQYHKRPHLVRAVLTAFGCCCAWLFVAFDSALWPFALVTVGTAWFGNEAIFVRWRRQVVLELRRRSIHAP